MTSNAATLQNNVRLRVFLILVISIGIRALRSLASDSVHKATGTLEVNYLLYALVLISSLIPMKSAWAMGVLSSLLATISSGTVVTLGSLSTYRCIMNQHTGCIQHSPWSILTLVLVGLNFLLNAYQTWTMYMILRGPKYVSSAAQRLRIIFAWALPFAWLINIVLLIESEWTLSVAGHLAADPIIIIMARAEENVLIGIIILALLVGDVAAYFLFVSNDLARSAILVQIGLTVTGLILLFVHPRPAGSSDDSGDKGGSVDAEDFGNDEEFLPSKTSNLRSRNKSKSGTTLKF